MQLGKRARKLRPMHHTPHSHLRAAPFISITMHIPFTCVLHPSSCTMQIPTSLTTSIDGKAYAKTRHASKASRYRPDAAGGGE